MANEQMDNMIAYAYLLYDDCESIVIVVPHLILFFAGDSKKKAVEN